MQTLPPLLWRRSNLYNLYLSICNSKVVTVVFSQVSKIVMISVFPSEARSHSSDKWARFLSDPIFRWTIPSPVLLEFDAPFGWLGLSLSIRFNEQRLCRCTPLAVVFGKVKTVDSVEGRDWLVTQTPNITWYSLPNDSRGICARKYYNRCNNKWIKWSFFAMLSHCFSRFCDSILSLVQIFFSFVFGYCNV